MNILVIEDNADITANLYDYLEPRGHGVDSADDGPTGLDRALNNGYDVIVLDLLLPGLDGIEVCARLRDAGNDTPVLMLTARDTLKDKVTGLACGADDYLVKPFALPELEARLAALIRRARGEQGRRLLQVADLTLETTTLRVVRAGRQIDLAPIPMRILTLLMRESPRVVRRAEIERIVWDDNPPDSDALKAHLHLLRTAIDKPFAEALLRNVHGVGYRLVAPDARPETSADAAADALTDAL
jgi:DNA-binding response OmpR family regulator